MSPRWHRKSKPVWLKLVSWTTHVGTSATWLAQWCPLEMLCFLHSGVHRGHLARVLLRNLTNFIDLYRISLRGHCCTAFRRHSLLKHTKHHFSLCFSTATSTIVVRYIAYRILWVAGGICVAASALTATAVPTSDPTLP